MENEGRKKNPFSCYSFIALPKENLFPLFSKSQLDLYQLCKMMNECLVRYYCLSHSYLCQ